MSFADDLRQELSHLPLGKPCCIKSELDALTVSCASILRQAGENRLIYRSFSPAVIRRVFTLLKRLFDAAPQTSYQKHPAFGGRREYRLVLQGADAQKAMSQLLSGLTGALPRDGLRRACCRRALCRGLFLGLGSVSAPDKQYHAEFVLPHKPAARALSRILVLSGLHPTETTRRGQIVVTLRQAEEVSDLVSLMGAGRATIVYEDQRMRRALLGNLNRQTNCDSANMNKQLGAAARQIAAIERLRGTDSWDKLSQAVQTTALLRLRRPEVSLSDLADLHKPKVSKATVIRRLRLLETAGGETVDATKSGQADTL